MAGERKFTALSILLVIGLNLMFFAVSPIIEPSLRAQIQIMQISIPILAAVILIAAARRRPS
jgi:hypothetical protein